jgi:predicted nucleotidyltransferase
MPAYPTPAHERAAVEITRSFAERTDAEAVLLTNSCARGKATPDSCLDMLVLVAAGSPARARLEEEWVRFRDESDAVAELRRAGRWSVVHLDVEDGVFRPGPILDEFDWFEVQVGNALVYSLPLFERGDRLERLRADWLPFYDEALRAERLAEARRYCLEFLERIPWYLDRELWFQALDRLHSAFRGFLLGLHVARRTYPISYDKWIREQVAGNLGLPERYEQLPTLFELRRLESRELEDKAAQLRALVVSYLG